MVDIELLLNGLQDGTACGAAGSGLFNELVKGKTKAEVEANPAARPILEYIKTAKENFRGQPIPSIPFSLYKLFDTSGARGEYQEVFFDHRARLIVYTLAVWFWGKEEDIHALEDTIWAICDEYTWCLPAHLRNKSLTPFPGQTYRMGILKDNGFDNRRRIDLTASETGFALAETCAMLGDLLSPVVVDRARAEIHHRVIRGFLEDGAVQAWELMANNWCAVVAGSIGCAAMYLVEDDNYLTGIIHRLLPTMDRFLGSFPDDGTSLEGLSYWNYGFGFFVSFADLLYRRTGGKINLFDSPKVNAIARFQQDCYFPFGGTVNFSDAQNAGFGVGLTCYLAGRYEDVKVPPRRYALYVSDRERGRLSTVIRDFLWGDEKLFKEYNPPPCNVFPEAQWLLCRSEDVGFASKGGHNDDSHNHNDVGSFFYYKRGKMVFCDLGRGEYCRQYFGPERYTFFAVQSQGHNLPIINNLGQKPGKEFRAKRCDITPQGEMTVEFADAYGISELKKLERFYKFDFQNGSLKIIDSFKLEKPVPVVERFISFFNPEIKDDTALFDTGEAKVALKFPKGITPKIGEVHYVDNLYRDVKVYTIDFPFDAGNPEFKAEFFIG